MSVVVVGSVVVDVVVGSVVDGSVVLVVSPSLTPLVEPVVVASEPALVVVISPVAVVVLPSESVAEFVPTLSSPPQAPIKVQRSTGATPRRIITFRCTSIDIHPSLKDIAFTRLALWHEAHRPEPFLRTRVGVGRRAGLDLRSGPGHRGTGTRSSTGTHPNSRPGPEPGSDRAPTGLSAGLTTGLTAGC